MKVVQMGAHTLEIDDSANLVIMRVVGDLGIDDLKVFFSLLAKMNADGPVYTIADLRRAASLTAAARKYVVATADTVTIGGNVGFGMNTVVRVIFIMVSRALALLRPTFGMSRMHLVKTEEEAHTFISDLIARRGSQAGSARSDIG